MLSCRGQLVGWSVHQHFGLRREWLGLVLREPQRWAAVGGLGPRQVQSLARWLRTTGLLDQRGKATTLYRVLEATWPEARLGWQLVWVNVIFNFPTARWYALRMGLGEWDTLQLRRALQSSVPRLAAHTVSNAILELVGLLERTPIGYEFGQGHVTTSRPRCVVREGLRNVATPALLYAVQRLFLVEGRPHLAFDEDLVWPWLLFGCTFEMSLPQLAGDDAPWFSLDGQGLHLHISMEGLRDVALF